MNDTSTDQQSTIPVIEEELRVQKRVVPGRAVRLEKRVERERVAIDELLTREEIEVERRPVGRVLDDDEEPLIERREDGLTVIPVVEERLVVRVERVLTEEVHVRRSQKLRRVRDEVELRRERIDVEEDVEQEDF